MAITTVTFDRAAIEQLDNMFGKHTKELQELARSMAKQVGGGSMGMPGVRHRDTLEGAKEELDSFIKFLTKGKQSLSATEKYSMEAAKRELKATNDSIAAIELERKRREEAGEASDENTKAQGKNTDEVKKSAGRLADFAEKVVGGTLSFGAMNKAINEFSQAYKQGFNWNAMSDSVNAALQMGMSPKDMMDFQKRFRRVSNTFEDGITGFNETVGKSNVEWLHYTGSLKDAAIAQGEFYDLALSMGIGAKDMKGAVGGLFSEFKKLQSATSMTAEEFVATQKSLLAEKTVRDKLIGLQGRERTNYMLKLTDTAYMFQTLGMQKEVAESLVKSLQSQAGETGVGRIVEGAQLQAFAGTIGMGKDGARIRELAGNRNRSKADDAEFTGYMRDMAKEVESRKNRGQGSELFMDAIEKSLPAAAKLINTLGGPAALAEGASASPKALDKQQADLAARDSGVLGAIKENIVRIADIMGGWSGSALAALLGAGAAKGILGAGKRWLGGTPPGGGPGGGPGGNPPPGKWAAGAAMVGKFAKTGMYAAIAGTAATAVVETLVKDNNLKGILESGINGAGIGATIGSVVPFAGTAVGAAVGGVGGLLVGMVMNQETLSDGLDKQKKQIVDQTSLDQIRFEQAQKAYQTEINQLEQKTKISDEAQTRIDALKAAMQQSETNHNSTQAKLAGANTGYEIGKQLDTQDWISQSANKIKRGSWWGGDTSADDTNSIISQMAAKLQANGLTLTTDEIRAQVSSKLDPMITSAGVGTDKQNALIDAQRSIGAGQGTFPGSVNPIIAQILQDYQGQISAGFSNTNQASFDTKFNTPAALAGLADQVKTTADQLTKDKAAQASNQISPSEYDTSGLEASKLQKRIDLEQSTLDVLQQLAARDTTVKFESGDKLVEALTKIADRIQLNSGAAPIRK